MNKRKHWNKIQLKYMQSLQVKKSLINFKKHEWQRSLKSN